MSNKWRLCCKLFLLVVLLIPAAALAADSYTRGNPCHAESTLYYSDASRTTVVGGNEYFCWDGHYVWGQWTPYYSYTYYGPCCDVCTNTGVCGIDP